MKHLKDNSAALAMTLLSTGDSSYNIKNKIEYKTKDLKLFTRKVNN